MPLWGDRAVETPKIDALAKEGETFVKTFSTAPVCSPSRSAMMIGKMQTTVGVHNHCDSRGRHQVYLPPPVRTLPEMFREHGYYTFNQGKDDYNFHYDRSNLYSEENDWTARANGQPFFGQLQFKGGKNAREPAVKVDRNVIPIPGCYPDHPVVREEIALHYDRIKVVDEEVGEVIDKLKRDGVYENTIIVFVGDHGMRMLRHKQFLYDGGIHVPLIIAAPGGHPALTNGKVNDELVSGIDVSATSLALCGIEPPGWMDGNDLFAADHIPRRHVIAARDRCDYTIDRIRCVRTERYKYIRNFMPERPYLQSQYRDTEASHGLPFTQVLKDLHAAGKMPGGQDGFYGPDRPAEELYDLSSDPWELRNLTNSSEHEEVLREMRRILEDWIEKTDDKGQYPEPIEAHMDVIDHKAKWGDEAVGPEFDRARAALNAEHCQPQADQPRRKHPSSLPLRGATPGKLNTEH